MLPCEETASPFVTFTTRPSVRSEFVTPERHRNGIGGALKREIESLVAARGIGPLSGRSSIAAKGFYRPLGFVAVCDEFHGPERTIIMEKALRRQ